MAPTITAIAPQPTRRLRAVSASGGRPLNRDEALRQVRDARRRLQTRDERFAHLKRQYD